jgi:D-tyrosyl-tRNA(Tyr) deacylase
VRAVIQRVKSAHVDVDSKTVGKIGYGILVYCGFESGDSQAEAEYMAKKILNLRIFPDDNGRMNLSLLDCPKGEILSISQFTLASHIKKGRRPDFNNALDPESALPLYNFFNTKLEEKIKVKKGVFGAMMEVYSVNDGPVTFIIEKKFK